ncbi:hypothetical protein [Lapillicoccus jejuensis]|uniref:Galactose oxidase-like protein n=1 Tax=Lapillicoccus jejuensis TaxID=402171 RepID=A0A542DXX5_9MICO|nr:hypothetical protein [Lapillicoccus jejuensis]TQJ07926.1 hypothetical protein FB458_0998 [Lapillicoccus jejuensis]
MTTDDELGRALVESLTYVGSRTRTPPGLLERLRADLAPTPTRRVRWAPLAAAAAVLLLLSLAGVAVLRHAPDPVREPATTGAPPTYGSRSAASLASARWSTLPAAPIQGRGSAVGVWTGARLLVWGGASPSSPQQPLGDGASYDPVARVWARLPVAPIAARSSSASVWTGSVLFVWGGFTTASGARASDGATYDPVARVWHRVPPAPVAGYQQALALTAGGSVLLVTTPPGDGAHVVHLQAYRPDTDTWTRLPDLDLPDGHPALEVEALSTGDRLLLWSMWAHTVPVDGNGTETTYGIEGFTYDVAQQQWTPNGLGGTSVSAVRGPLWTGREVLLPAAPRYCGGCSGPIGGDLTGLRLDPTSGARSNIPHGPVDDGNPTDLWTGTALLALDARGSSGSSWPGAAAVWDPATGGWARLPDAPLGGTDGVVVWTGRSVLLWGTFSSGADPAGRTGGLELG